MPAWRRRCLHTGGASARHVRAWRDSPNNTNTPTTSPTTLPSPTSTPRAPATTTTCIADLVWLPGAPPNYIYVFLGMSFAWAIKQADRALMFLCLLSAEADCTLHMRKPSCHCVTLSYVTKRHMDCVPVCDPRRHGVHINGCAYNLGTSSLFVSLLSTRGIRV